MLPLAASAQTDAHALEQAWKGKQKPLRSYSADPIARFDWTDGTLAESPITIHTLAIFTTHSVKLKSGKLVVEGDRATLVQNKKKAIVASEASAPMTLEIDLHGADPATAFPSLEPLLFFPDTTTAIAALPHPVQDMLASELGVATEPANCKCLRLLIDGHWVSKEYEDPLLKAPRLTAVPKPNFNATAHKHVSGSIGLLLFVTDTGRVGQVWLTKPIGHGLDESEETEVRSYIFKPAQYDGKVVFAAFSYGVDLDLS